MSIQTRWDAIPDIRYCIHEAGLDAPNPEILLQTMIAENDTDTMDLLESKVAVVAEKTAMQNLRFKALDKRILGQKAIDYLAALNEAKQLEGQDILDLLSALAIPKGLLESGSISTAIGYIEQMSLPDNITEDDRSSILDLLESELAAIEARYA